MQRKKKKRKDLHFTIYMIIFGFVLALFLHSINQNLKDFADWMNHSFLHLSLSLSISLVIFNSHQEWNVYKWFTFQNKNNKTTKNIQNTKRVRLKRWKFSTFKFLQWCKFLFFLPSLSPFYKEKKPETLKLFFGLRNQKKKFFLSGLSLTEFQFQNSDPDQQTKTWLTSN